MCVGPHQASRERDSDIPKGSHFPSTQPKSGHGTALTYRITSRHDS